MKAIFLLLFFCLSCSIKNQHEKKLRLIVIENGISHAISLPLKFKDGLFLLFSNEIDELIHGKIENGRNPFSYVSPRKVEIQVLDFDLDAYLLFSSFRQEGAVLLKKELTNYVVGIANKKYWKRTEAKTGPNNFFLITKQDSLIDANHWKKSVIKIWNYYQKRLSPTSEAVTFIELDWAPISGGPLGENVLGVFSQKEISQEGQVEIKNDLDWDPRKSTKDYVTEYYKGSTHPWNDYLLGTYAHELAHLYFGFGKTRERVNKAHEVWFSLGMGMLYDIEITQALTGQYPVLFSSSEKVWKKFSKIKEIDQRLIHPNVTSDQKYSLDRKKVFAHSKALSFLKTLRQEIGVINFDNATRAYLKDCSACENGYEDFSKFLSPFKSRLEQVEKKFSIK